MTRFASSLAISLSLFALACMGFVLARELVVPDTGVSEVELDRLRVRQNELEARLASLASEPSARPTRVSGSATPREPAEGAEGDGAPTAESALLARLEVLETRLRGLEEDPVERAYTYLESENEELRKLGVHSLEALAKSDPEARAALREMLKDPDAGVRAAALRTIAAIDDKDGVPFAASLLDDEDAEVRREAINTLTRLGTKDAASEIASLIADENDEVRRLAVDSMGKLGYQDSAAALRSALEDLNLGVRGEAISSLGEIGATESLARLRDLYAAQTEHGAHQDADHRVRLAMAMKQLGDPTAAQAEIVRLGNLVHYSDNVGAMRALMLIGRNEPLATEIFRKAAEVSESEWIRREARRMLAGNTEAERK